MFETKEDEMVWRFGCFYVLEDLMSEWDQGSLFCVGQDMVNA